VKGVKRTRFKTCILVALLAAFLISLLFSIGFYSNIQLKLSDFLYGGGQPLDNIAIIAIDDVSINEIGRWPWERGNFTDLLGHLDQSKVVAFDVAFFESSTQEIDDGLAQAIAEAGNVVMPAEYIEFEQKDGRIIGKEVIAPIPQIKEAAASLGYINVITDNDGITRAVNTNIEGEYDHFAHAVLNQYIQKPVVKETRFLVNFIARPGAYDRYRFLDVVEGKYDNEEFKDKIVLIGATAPNLHDDYFVPTSYGKAMPGVEIHANVVQQLLTGKHVRHAPDWLTILIIFIVSIIVALLVYYFPIWLAALLSVAAMLLYVFVAIFVFDTGMILNIVYVPVGIVIAYLATMMYFYVSERKSKRQIRGAFEKYVSKDVISHIMEHPDRLKLGGEKRTITVFFSDIRGFTTISEKLSPEQLVHLLNDYLTEMTDIILKYNGVVDKYMGDAIMAFWNAPLNQPKHAELACSAALSMEKRLKQLQRKWKADGVPHLEIGVGLNTGPAVVGNMGSYDRFDYTAMGDTVNLGSRLEGLNKPYGTRNIISETTQDKIKNRSFLVRKLDRVRVKGKKEPITIFELASRKEDAEEWYSDVINHFEKGLELYFKQKWDAAKKEFKAGLAMRKEKGKEDDGPSKAFIERCDYFKKHPPGKGWDGVWVMKTK
jgi:adenylate cyclase